MRRTRAQAPDTPAPGEVPPASTPPRPPPPGALRWALLAAPVVVLLAGAWSRRWMSDDGFIHLRVVRNLVEGHGPVFNPGERVEASTSALWVGVLAAGDVLSPVRLEWIAVVVGILATVGAVVLAMAGAATLRRWSPGVELPVPVGAAVLAALVPYWTYASSGLEGGLVLAWLGASLLVLSRWAARRRLPMWSPVVLGLGPLIRPELGLLTVLFLAVLLVGGWREDDGRRRAAVVAAALVLPVAYQVFRMGYYGSLVPNPAVAKEASRAWWGQGWDYLRTFADPYWLWVPVLLLAAGALLPLVRELRTAGRQRELLVVAAFTGGGLLHAVYIVRVGGDFMHARLLLPSLFAFVAPVAVVPLRRAYAGAMLVVPWALVAGTSLRADADTVTGFGTEAGAVSVEDFGWGPGQPQRAWFDGRGLYYIRTPLPVEPAPELPDPTVAEFGVGMVGYALGPDVHVFDMVGLGDPLTAHLELGERGLVAHEKALSPPWVAARLADDPTELDPADLPAGWFGAEPVVSGDDERFDRQAVAARRVLACREVRSFRQSYEGDLTPGRFLENLLEAPGNWRFRIPKDPVAAEAELCDGQDAARG